MPTRAQMPRDAGIRALDIKGEGEITHYRHQPQIEIVQGVAQKEILITLCMRPGETTAHQIAIKDEQ